MFPLARKASSAECGVMNLNGDPKLYMQEIFDVARLL